jgi:hypothetical protein
MENNGDINARVILSCMNASQIVIRFLNTNLTAKHSLGMLRIKWRD